MGENVALPLLQHTDKSVDEIEEIVEQKLQMVGLTGFEDLRPDEISGGMKKRVGLARALALDPELLFSDEPTSGLDPIMTAVVDELTMKLTRGKGMTAVVVSHDMTSAFRIATRMIMLGHGGIVAQGTPDEIRASSNPEVQQFIKGEPDGPIPLNLSQEEHEHHQHVKPRPFARSTRQISSQDRMKRNLSDYFVALFVIVCSVVLLGALTFALSGRQLKKPTRTLQINYEDVTGIKVNSEVRYAGAPAGRVIAMRHLTAQGARSERKQEGRGAGDRQPRRRNSAVAHRCNCHAKLRHDAIAEICGAFRRHTRRSDAGKQRVDRRPSRIRARANHRGSRSVVR